MRDEQIMRAHSEMAQAMNYNMAQTAQTISRIGARLTAFERMFFGHRLSMFRMMLLCLLSPKSVIHGLNALEKEILKQLHADAKAKMESNQKRTPPPSILLPKGGLVKP